MATKNVLSLIDSSVYGSRAELFVSQIAAGEDTHAIAVERGIRFFNGQNDDSGVLWTGATGLEVVIPTLGDIIANPVTLKGIVAASAAENWPDGQNGDMVYIGEACTFASEACEAGDMAVWYEGAWHVIQGENQVAILGTAENNVVTANLSDGATSVLSVEGKTLSLAVDYEAIDSKIVLTKNTAMSDILLRNGSVSVAAMSLALSKENDSVLNISKAESITYGSALADGTVNFGDTKVLVSDDINWDAGSLGSIVKNSAAVSASVSHNLAIGKANESDGASGVYVTDITAIQGISFVDGTSVDKSLAFVSGLTADTSNAKSFVSGIHAWTVADSDNPADFTIPGAVTAPSAANTFVTGLSSEGSDVVTGVTVGTVSVVSGDDFLASLSSEGSDVVTSVSFGSATLDTNASWFFSGLDSNGSDVITSVSFGTVSLYSDNTFASSAIVAASVSDHVLTFNTGSFMTPVNVSFSGYSVSSKGFETAGVSLTGFSSSTGGFVKGAISQADSVITKGGFTTSAVSLAAGAEISYYVDKATEHAYVADMSYVKLSYTEASFSKNTPVIENPTITATIAANTFAVDYSGAALPSLSFDAPTGTLSASVATALSTSTYSWAGIDVTKQNAVEIPGAYSLTSDSTATGAITVAAASDYGVTGEISLAENLFVTDVEISHS